MGRELLNLLASRHLTIPPPLSVCNSQSFLHSSSLHSSLFAFTSFGLFSLSTLDLISLFTLHPSLFRKAHPSLFRNKYFRPYTTRHFHAHCDACVKQLTFAMPTRTLHKGHAEGGKVRAQSPASAGRGARALRAPGISGHQSAGDRGGWRSLDGKRVSPLSRQTSHLQYPAH